MKSFASVALLGAALVAAVPMEEKRNIVWHTTWVEVTETVVTTTTKWVAPSSEVSVAAVNPGGDFHETAVHYSMPSYNKPSKTPEAPVPTTSSIVQPPPPPPAPTTPTSTYVAPPPPKPTTTSVYVPPPPPETSVYVAPTPVSVYTPPPAPETSTPAPAPAPAAPSYGSGSGSQGGSSSGGSSSGGASYSGVALTYYAPGLGSCGITSSDGDMIVAVAASTMTKTYSGNPNNNPLCGKKISLTANGKTETATIVDTCPGCKGPTDLDLSPSLFQKFADESVGVISGASWKLLD